MVTKNNTTNTSQPIVISYFHKVIGFYAACVIAGGIFIISSILGLIGLFSFSIGGFFIFLICLLAALLFGGFTWYIYAIHIPILKKGIVIDFENDRIELPGECRTINELSDYLYYFKRVEFNISGIEQMSSEVSSSMDDKGNVHYYYTIIVSGSSIGSYTIGLDDEAKMQHLYGLLANANEMGVPVLNR